MHVSFFLLTVVFAICPKWHLIHLTYQRIYNRYKIRQWLFWFCSKNRERDSTKTWMRALLVVIFCNIWPKRLLVNNIALPHLWKHSRSTTIKWGLESWASCEILSLWTTEMSAGSSWQITPCGWVAAIQHVKKKQHIWAHKIHRYMHFIKKKAAWCMILN